MRAIFATGKAMTTQSGNRPDRRHLYARSLGRLVPLVAVMVVVAGCSARSYASLDKIARSVPAPAGLTFTGTEHGSSKAGLGSATHEANAGYTNPPMPCSQLRAEWISTLIASHWTIDETQSGPVRIGIKSSQARIGILLDGLTTCSDSVVTAQG